MCHPLLVSAVSTDPGAVALWPLAYRHFSLAHRHVETPPFPSHSLAGEIQQ